MDRPRLRPVLFETPSDSVTARVQTTVQFRDASWVCGFSRSVVVPAALLAVPDRFSERPDTKPRLDVQGAVLIILDVQGAVLALVVRQ